MAWRNCGPDTPANPPVDHFRHRCPRRVSVPILAVMTGRHAFGLEFQPHVRTFNRTLSSNHRCNMAKATSNASARQGAKSASTRQIAKNAIKGGPKDVKKDKRMGVGRGAKG